METLCTKLKQVNSAKFPPWLFLMLQDGKQEVLSYTGELTLVRKSQKGCLCHSVFSLFTDQIQNSFSVTVWFLLLKQWSDEFLHWNTSQYPGIWGVTLPIEKLWMPDVNVGNRWTDSSLKNVCCDCTQKKNWLDCSFLGSKRSSLRHWSWLKTASEKVEPWSCSFKLSENWLENVQAFRFDINSATDVRKINWVQNMMAIVFPTGRVVFIIKSDFHTTCSLDMTQFPFDSQTCYLDICLQMYPQISVNLTTGNSNCFLFSHHQFLPFTFDFPRIQGRPQGT